MAEVKFEPVLFIAWGDRENMLGPHFETAGQQALMMAPGKRLRPLPVILRLDANNGIHILDGAGSAILSFSFNGDFSRKTNTGVTANATVIDFLPGSNWYILLYRMDNGQYVVRKTDDTGAVLWTTPVAQENVSPGKIVLANGKIFISSQSDPHTLFEMAAGNGNTFDKKQLEQPMARPFGITSGEIISATYFPDLQRRGIAIYEPATGTESKTVCAKELYGPLSSAIGADDEKNCYLFSSNATNSAHGLLKIDTTGHILNQINFPMFSTGKDHELITITTDGNQLKIVRSASPGKEQTVQVSEEMREYLPGRMNIVGLEQDQLVIDLLGKQGGFEKRVLAGPDGKWIKEMPVAEETVIAHVPSYVNWAVSGNGMLYFPFCNEHGIMVIKTKI